jgi:hypothetical protein
MSKPNQSNVQYISTEKCGNIDMNVSKLEQSINKSKYRFSRSILSIGGRLIKIDKTSRTMTRMPINPKTKVEASI